MFGFVGVALMFVSSRPWEESPVKSVVLSW